MFKFFKATNEDYRAKEAHIEKIFKLMETYNIRNFNDKEMNVFYPGKDVKNSMLSDPTPSRGLNNPFGEDSL